MEGLKVDFQRRNFNISTLEFHYMLKNTCRCKAYEIKDGELKWKNRLYKLLADVGFVCDRDPQES
jgi:hypothetical protein